MLNRTQSIFPVLASSSWVQVDLDRVAAAEMPAHGENPLNDPETCDRWVRGVARRARADFTWGGWLEDRTRLWRGHYMPDGCFTHVAIDLNVPAGTAVAAADDCEVVHSEPCHLSGGGWGGWVIVRFDRPHGTVTHLLHGHLAHDGLPATGTRLVRGQVFATVGLAHENGGWFPHLHLQALSEEAWSIWSGCLEDLDGYAVPGSNLASLFPDPVPLIGLPPSAAACWRRLD